MIHYRSYDFFRAPNWRNYSSKLEQFKCALCKAAVPKDDKLIEVYIFRQNVRNTVQSTMRFQIHVNLEKARPAPAAECRQVQRCRGRQVRVRVPALSRVPGPLQSLAQSGGPHEEGPQGSREGLRSVRPRSRQELPRLSSLRPASTIRPQAVLRAPLCK